VVFRRFAELQSIRQVLVWFRQEKIPLPVLTVGDAAERIVWKAPAYSTMHHILTNPVYAGAYAFGRRTMRVARGISHNATGKRFMSRGAIRRGEALLLGLFRCARCGRKLRVRYSDGAARYQCVGAFSGGRPLHQLQRNARRPDGRQGGV